MEKLTKTYFIPAILLIVKLLVTLRTAIDTYDISADILDVLVIDGGYLALWFVAAYSGKGQTAMALRPFAAGGAWVLYLLMLYIAWHAGDLRGDSSAIVVSMIARVTGAVLLLYDTYDYVAALVQQRQKDSAASWKDSLRGSVSALTYFLGAVIAAPFVMLLNLYNVGRDYWSDTEAQTAKPRVIVESKVSQIDTSKSPQLTAPRVTKSTAIAVSPPQNDITDRLIAVYRDNPKLSLRKAGDAVGVSGETVRRYLIAMEADGRIHKNGSGVEVL
jgi:hypothetical protein